MKIPCYTFGHDDCATSQKGKKFSAQNDFEDEPLRNEIVQNFCLWSDLIADYLAQSRTSLDFPTKSCKNGNILGRIAHFITFPFIHSLWWLCFK